MDVSSNREAIDRTSTSAQLADILRARILTGELAAGTRIREVALAQGFGVSRNTAREGVRILTGEGLLIHQPHKGTAVATVNAHDVEEIYAARRMIELNAIRSLKGRPPSGALAALHDAIDLMDAAVDQEDVHGMREADTRFHQAITQFLNNERIASFETALLRELRLALAMLDLFDADYLNRWTMEHERIAEALEEGEADEAARLMLSHLQEAEERLAAALRAD